MKYVAFGIRNLFSYKEERDIFEIMVAITAERRSPFRPIENPFRRVLPAVDKMKSNVIQTIRSTGEALAQRMQRSHVEDSARLLQARATIATETHRPSIKKAIIHNVVEATKNSAPAAIVGAGARIALGAGLGLQTMAVAAGASAVSRGVREATFTIRKGAYSETTKLITKHEEASTLANFDRTTRQAHTGIRAQQDRFAQTGAGKIVNAVLHGGEKKIAQFAYGKHRHAKALMQARTQDIHTLSDKELIALREHAVMARITHGTAADVYEMRKLAKSTYQSVNQELATRGITRNKAHERQLQLYKKDVRVGAAVNVIGQAGLAALKAVPKTVATFFITDAFLKAIHVDTSNRHNPLEGLDQTVLGHAVQNAKASVLSVDLKQKFAHVGDNAIAWIGKVIAPKSVAYADELMPDTSNAVQTAASNVRHATRAVHASSDWTHEAHGSVAQATHDPRITVRTEVVNGKTMVSGSGVLASESPKPMAVPGIPDPVPLVVEVDERHVAHAVVHVQEHVTTPQVVTTIVHEQIGGKTSLTQDIFDRKLIPGMESAPDAVTWYGQSGTAVQMMEHIIIPNSDKLTPENIAQLQEYVNAHPDASFGALWHANRNVFAGGMDTWSMGTGYNVAVDHVVSQQDTLAAAQISRVEQVDNAGSGRVSGHAMIAINNTAKPVQAPPQPTRMSNEEYLAMRQAVASGQPVHANGGTSMATPNGGTLTPEQYLAMTKNNASVTPASPASVGSSVNGNVSVEEYQRLIAQTQQVNANLGEAVNTPTTVHNPRMDTDEYLRIQRETAAKAAESARASQQMDPQEYMRKVAEINARNGGASNVSATPVTSWEGSQVTSTEASVIGPVDLRNGLNHTMSISSDSPSMFHTSDTSGNLLPINTTNIMMTQVVNPNIYIDTPAYNSVTYFYDPVEGGLVVNGHTGRYGGKIQLLEGFREYVEGYGFNGHLLYGPAQIQRLAQEYITLNSGSTTNFTFDGNSISTRLTSFSVDYQDSDYTFGEPYRLIGSGPDTITLVGCSWSHVEAIGMISALERQAGFSIPAEYSSVFQILKDPSASAEQVTGAVQRILPWLRQLKNENKFDYDTFHTLIGNLPGESKTFDEMPGLADHGKIRMIFELVK